MQLADIFTKHSGFKLLGYQLPEELLAHIFQDESNRFVFLWRENLLQAVVSVLIAQQTQLWQIWDADKPVIEYYKQLNPLDVEDVKRPVETLKCDLERFDQSLDRLASGRVFKLDYEALYFSPNEQQQA